MRGLKRRLPYPADIRIAGTALMLGYPKGQTALVAKKTISLASVAPSDYSYGSQNPRVGRNQSYEAFPGGYGQDQQDGFQVTRYRDALGVDASVHPRVLGPDIDTLTPATTDATNGGTAPGFTLLGVEYAVMGRYCLIRDSDATWSVSKDFGADKAATDAIVITPNSGSTPYAYVAMGDAEYFYRFDGTTWEQHASLYARAWLRIGHDFYRAHDTNMLAKVDVNADPWTAGNWTADNAFRIGDKSAGITKLAKTATGVMVVFKEDGVYSLDAAGEDVQYFPFLRFSPSSENGKYTFDYGNDLVSTYREGTFTLGADLSYTPMGPERQTSGYTGDVKGRITAGLGHGTFRAYGWIYNPDTDDSYLMVWDGSVWHGSISAAFENQKITAMWRSTVGAPTGHQRAYFTTSIGTIGWFTLPCTPHPANCDEYGFVQTGTLTHTRFTGGFLKEPKTLRALTVQGPNLTSTQYVTYDYKTDVAASSYTAFGNTFDGRVETANFATNTSATVAELRETLTSSSSTASPQVAGMALNHALRDDLILEYSGVVLADDALTYHNGTPCRLSAEAIRDVLLAAAAAQGSVTVILPDEQSKALSFIDYGEAMALDPRRQWKAGLSWTAVEFITQQVYGTWDRLSAYTYPQLESYSWDSFESL